MHSFGALLGLVTAICLIIRKIPPFWSLAVGAAVGGILVSFDISATMMAMLWGMVDMLSPAVCILASGLLAGALIQTGSAERIARTVLKYLGRRWTVAAVACAVMLLTASGVFVDIAVITAAPIALTIGRKTGYTPGCILLAMIGGGKAGNIISPNPNTIAAAKAFDLELTSVMAANLIPAICALLVTILLCTAWEKGREVGFETPDADRSLPSVMAAISGPAAVMALLLLRPVLGIAIDPIIALPAGSLICLLACGCMDKVREIYGYGLREVAGVALVLLGTGMLSGVIQMSNLQLDVIHALEILHLPPFLLAPFSGILMGGAASSTTAGTAIASAAFGPALLEASVPAISSAAMIHAGATVLDSLPHGSFFHATAGCAQLDLKQRLQLIPLEAAIGLTSTVVAVLLYLVISG